MKHTVYETAPRKTRVFLAGVWDDRTPKQVCESLIAELESLALTLGLEVAGKELVHLRAAQNTYGVGKGKAEEIAENCAALEANCLILDWDLSPSQQRNWENLTGLPVMDRRELIIQIFADRAQTKEAVLQVELARLRFNLPRLTHKYINLARQRGGSYGAKGAGETKFETDRRIVLDRIHKLEKEIELVRNRRALLRKRREKEGLPVCALTGYTNSGKSSLLNALTGAGVLAENKLFATLDTTARRLALPVKQGNAQADSFILIDTVGFIRNLPHDLISAFRSTLEEVTYADVLAHVLDASSPDVIEQYKTVTRILADMGEDKKPAVTVLNKTDLPAREGTEEALSALGADIVRISALNGSGLAGLIDKIGTVCAGLNK